jgi:peptide/nickel transport system ATP-binding protein
MTMPLQGAQAPILKVQGLSVQVRAPGGIAAVVRQLDLALMRGQTFALVGESGSGKSMTALALLRLLPDAARLEHGRVELDGRDLLQLSESDMRSVRGGRVGMVFQEPSNSLNPVMSIGQQIVETIRVHTSLRGKQAADKAIQWLERVGIPNAPSRFNDYPFQFSGGQKQRIMIAIALAAEPAVLLADEPTTALDVTVQGQILQLLADIQKEMGLAILLITHDLAVVRQVAHYVALMRHGEIVETGDVDAFFASPRHPYAKALLAAIPSYEKRGKPLLLAESNTSNSDRSAMASQSAQSGLPLSSGTGSSDTNLAALSGTASPAVVLSIQDLVVAYPQRRGLLRRSRSQTPVVDGVSLDLRQGETLALLGESGCGKTTLAKALLRLLDRQAVIQGRALLNGQSLLDARGSALQRLRRELQIVFQDPYASLDPRRVVGDILEEGMAALRPEQSRTDRSRAVQALVDRVGLPANTVNRYPHEFSGGQRQRIAIARALAVQPKVLVCDEPTSALDVSVQAQIIALLQSLQKESGMAYLFITHNFGVVEYMADRIAIMHGGRIVEQGSTDQVLNSPRHEQTRRLLQAVPRI